MMSVFSLHTLQNPSARNPYTELLWNVKVNILKCQKSTSITVTCTWFIRQEVCLVGQPY